MALILHIETATEVCSVALSENENVLAFRETKDTNVHSKKLTVYIESLFTKTKRNFNELQAVTVSKGPGSYTGLRIGVSVAKGICYGLEIPLVSICTLQAMAYGFLKKHNVSGEDWLCPMIDARRMEVYTAFYNSRAEEVKTVSAEIIEKESFKSELEGRIVYFFGNGAAKCKTLITHPSAKFVEEIYPSAINLVQLAYKKYLAGQFENTAYFEPFYLKDFIATTPKKNIFK